MYTLSNFEIRCDITSTLDCVFTAIDLKTQCSMWNHSKTCIFYGCWKWSTQSIGSDITCNLEIGQSVEESCTFWFLIFLYHLAKQPFIIQYELANNANWGVRLHVLGYGVGLYNSEAFQKWLWRSLSSVAPALQVKYACSNRENR